MRYETGSNDIKVLRAHDADELRTSAPLHEDLTRLIRSIDTVIRKRYPDEKTRRRIREHVINELTENKL